MDSLLPLSAERSASGALRVGDCDATALAAHFGTPLVVLDQETFERRAEAYAEALGAERTYYAGKAFLCVAVCELLDRLGLGLDVCSGGELATALAADFPPERIVFHGNNKSEHELKVAGGAGVGRIVVDSFDEFDRIERLGISAKLLIRVTPGVEAHTHEYVRTGQEDSKFGFGLEKGSARAAVERALKLPGCELVGLHSHIGSQIFDVEPFEVAASTLADFSVELRKDLGLEVEELNVGGGLGVAHNDKEDPPDLADAVQRIARAVEEQFEEHGLHAPAICMEPGRSIVGPAGVTLYEIGTVKDIPGVRTYVSVNGGMSDNPRYALYGARYEAFLANRPSEAETRTVTIAGKHCESGDVLIDAVDLPLDAGVGDLVCLPATGAYTFSMASNYNRIPRPAVVLVDHGRTVEIVSRETEADLIARDRRLDGSPA